MKITVEIDDEELQKVITEMVAKEVIKKFEGTYNNSDMKQACTEAVKETVYSQKDELIDRCVKQASFELTRKSLPKLMEEFSNKKGK